MSGRVRNYLFLEESLDDQLRHRHGQVRGAVDGVPQDQFLVSSDEEIVAHFEEKMRIAPLVLHEEARSMEQSETQVDVSGDRNRFFSGDQRGPFFIAGTRVEISIPFTGAGWIFKYRTNPYIFDVSARHCAGGARGDARHAEDCHCSPE